MIGKLAGATVGTAIMVLLGGVGVTLPGCSALCSEDRKVVEVEYGDLEGLQTAHLNILREQGYDCRNDGAIRNGSGTTIGERWVCEKCD